MNLQRKKPIKIIEYLLLIDIFLIVNQHKDAQRFLLLFSECNTKLHYNWNMIAIQSLLLNVNFPELKNR